MKFDNWRDTCPTSFTIESPEDQQIVAALSARNAISQVLDEVNSSLRAIEHQRSMAVRQKRLLAEGLTFIERQIEYLIKESQ